MLVRGRNQELEAGWKKLAGWNEQSWGKHWSEWNPLRNILSSKKRLNICVKFKDFTFFFIFMHSDYYYEEISLYSLIFVAE